MRIKRFAAIGLFTLFLLVGSQVALADLVFSGSSGTLAASANFALVGQTLTVTLTNTSSHDVLVPTDVLTAVWFDTSKTLTPVSVSLGTSTVFYGTISNPSKGYGYYSGLAGGAHGMNDGLTAVGFGIGTGHSNFPGGGGANLNGLDYGILSAGDNSGTGNGGVTGGGPLVKNEVIFTLSTPVGFTLNDLGRTAVFQYGTALTDTTITSYVPDGGMTLMLLGGALVGLATLRRRFSD